MFRAGCLPPTYTLPRVCFGKARTPKEARRAAPRLCLYSQDNDVHGGVPCVPPLCIVFLDFRSRSARGRSATFRRSFGRQSAPSLPDRALCALRRITAYLHKAYFVAYRFYFAPVVGLQYMCSRTYISTERERQRNSGQPVLRWRFYIQDNIIRKRGAFAL